MQLFSITSLAVLLLFALYLGFSDTDVLFVHLYDPVSIYPSKAFIVLNVPLTFLKIFLVFTQFFFF